MESSVRGADAATATALAELFVECVVAPSFTPEALGILTQKKNIRVLEEEFDVEMDEEAALSVKTVGKAVHFIEALL